MSEKPQHGGRRANQTGRPPKADKLVPLPLRVPPGLREAYRKAPRSTQAAARRAAVEALRAALEAP